MIFVFYFFAALLVFLGYQSLRGGIDYLDYFKKESARPESGFTPFCSIIAPCRGIDENLSENLSALFRQNYARYEILFVVDSEEDAAVSIIKEIINRRDAETPRKEIQTQIDTDEHRLSQTKKDLSLKNSGSPRLGDENILSTKLVIAGQATESGQKVHNLRRAVLEVSGESEVFVFVDSDARTGKNWLKNLVAPLQDETIGATTGYRWFVAKRGGFFSALLSVWNASIASALGANRGKNFCWGGSTAIRRATFEKLEMREKWRGTLSDDFAVTRAIKEANLKIYFVPQCLAASYTDVSFRQLLEFTTRQLKITRVYAPHLWRASFTGAILFTFTFWTGFLILAFVSGFHFWLTLAVFLVIFALGATKATLRLQAVKVVLRDYQDELNKQFVSHALLWTLTPVLYFYNCFCALLSRRIVWRGIEYKLQSPTETVILGTRLENRQ